MIIRYGYGMKEHETSTSKALKVLGLITKKITDVEICYAFFTKRILIKAFCDDEQVEQVLLDATYDDYKSTLIELGINS